ncbi:MAG: hypothetical protein ABR518_05310 [Actinomycetota bacterium]
MVGIFLRLKIRLIRNGFRAHGFRIVFFILGAVFAAEFAVGGFAVLATSSGDPTARVALPVTGFTALFVGWLLIPAFGFGLDETLDPTRLTLLPLSRRQLMAGLFTASATGLGPAATLLALCGALVGYASFGPGTPIVAAAIALEFGCCVAGSRAVTAALSSLLRRRRVRDLWGIALFLFALLFNGLFQGVRFLGRTLTPDDLLQISRVMRWTPPGMLGQAIVDADGGRFGIALAGLLPPLVFVGDLGVWWATTLEGLTTRAEPVSAPRETERVGKAKRALPGGGLFPRAARFLPRNRWGAVAAKDLRYLSREPMLRAQRLTTFLFAIGAVVAVALVPAVRHPPTTLASSLLLWWFGLGAMSQFAQDRGAYWMNVAATGEPEDDLVGKNVVLGLMILPVFLIVAVATAALTGGWRYLPVAIATGLGSFGIALGVGNVVSVRFAQPMPETMTNLWAHTTGQGARTVGLMMIVFFGSQLLVAPIAVLVLLGLTSWSPLLIVAIPVSLAYGATMYVLGRKIAAEWLRHRQTQLLEALSPRAA